MAISEIPGKYFKPSSMDDGFFMIVGYGLRDARCRMQDAGDSLQVSDHRLVTTDHWLLVAGCW